MGRVRAEPDGAGSQQLSQAGRRQVWPRRAGIAGWHHQMRSLRPTAVGVLWRPWYATGLSHLDFAELGEEAGQEGVVPCGAHALCLHGPLGAFELGKVESEAPQ